MNKFALRRYSQHPDFMRTTIPWASCLPFVENSRGILIHRPRSAATITMHREPHIVIKYWCGGGVAGKKNLTLLDTPPAESILCEVCEQRAVEAGLPSADALAGRHVHKGKLKAIRTCGCADTMQIARVA